MSRVKKIAVLILVIVFLIFVVEYISTRIYSFAGNKIVSVNIKEAVFLAEVVSNSEKMQKGLGKRNGLCDECGMLFKFQQSGRYSFWMKDMNFPIDIIWIGKNKIVHLEKNVDPDFVGTVVSTENADVVLEINAGSVDELGIKVGDIASF
ncbi:MAG: hypothetical protein US70_C0001G0018 [Parcubacteria group bacterium GW2011_GWD2_38_11]|nr:MAG: hypothetical protein US70_C0001G0018 [Parcubacteria group bacterium GW2011_GWD2_38_11]